jgi:outer membrane receptor protein involved in Fe transport
MRSGEAGVSGSLFDLPAGALQLAAGASYRKEYTDNTVDSGITTNLVKSAAGDVSLVCDGPGSICSSPQQGGFNVKEAYAELLVPILKDHAVRASLNLDVGTRYSKYSNFGSTNNWKIALEFKPIEDLLMRGTVSKVFRAPSVTDLFGGPLGRLRRPRPIRAVRRANASRTILPARATTFTPHRNWPADRLSSRVRSTRTPTSARTCT